MNLLWSVSINKYSKKLYPAFTFQPYSNQLFLNLKSVEEQRKKAPLASHTSTLPADLKQVDCFSELGETWNALQFTQQWWRYFLVCILDRKWYLMLKQSTEYRDQVFLPKWAPTTRLAWIFCRLKQGPACPVSPFVEGLLKYWCRYKQGGKRETIQVV